MNKTPRAFDTDANGLNSFALLIFNRLIFPRRYEVHLFGFEFKLIKATTMFVVHVSIYSTFQIHFFPHFITDSIRRVSFYAKATYEFPL